MAREHFDYASYLLRFWRTEEDGQLVWRASLESTLDGQRLNFPNPEALMVFLETQFSPQRTERRGEQKSQLDPGNPYETCAKRPSSSLDIRGGG